MKVIGVIPARLASTRLPRKVLLPIAGNPLLQYVWEQACLSRVDEVIIATDTTEIYDAAIQFGARAEMTDASHSSGTSRIAELSGKVKADFYINIQGDEPLISPHLINSIVDEWRSGSGRQVYSAANPHCSDEDFLSPHVVKVVLNQRLDALYFSRAPIPYPRTAMEYQAAFKHIGLYGYTMEGLEVYANSQPGPLEQIESLEQLRFLEQGLAIRMVLTNYESVGVDTEEDFRKVKTIIETGNKGGTSSVE